MFKTVRAKLILTNVLMVALILILLVYNYASLQTMSGSQASSLRRAHDSGAALAASSIGAELYRIIADAVINRDLENLDKEWKTAKAEKLAEIQRLQTMVDTPEEKAKIDAALDAFNKLSDMYENTMLPALQSAVKVDDSIATIDGNMDTHVNDLKNNLGDIASTLFKESNDADAEFNARLGITVTAALIIGIFGLLLGTLLTLLGVRAVMSPMRQQLELLRDISEGDADLSRTLDETKQDEFGILAKHFNQFTSKLSGVIGTVRHSMQVLSEGSGTLSANTTQTAASLNQITSNIENITQLIINQSASITETTASVEEISKNVSFFHQSVQIQNKEVESSVARVENVLEEIKNISEQVNGTAHDFSELKNESSRGRMAIDEVISLVNEVSRKSDSLGETNKMIASIASQTNLLAMNAAIEAAHAGEAGRGFSVVADEIRKLAETAALQAKQTSSMLKDIKSQIDRISGATEVSGTIFTGIVERVVRVGEAQEKLQKSLADQTQSNKETLENFSKIQQISAEIGTGSQEIQQGAQSILDEMVRLVGISQQVRTGMEEISKGTQEINGAVHSINDLTGSTITAIKDVGAETDRFKLRV